MCAMMAIVTLDEVLSYDRYLETEPSGIPNCERACKATGLDRFSLHEIIRRHDSLKEKKSRDSVPEDQKVFDLD